SSLIWIAVPSRFCEFWMRKTMRKVTMVVPVLITSCHVSENPKIGPVIPHTRTVSDAAIKAVGRPAALDVKLAMSPNNFPTFCPPALFVVDFEPALLSLAFGMFQLLVKPTIKRPRNRWGSDRGCALR